MFKKSSREVADKIFQIFNMEHHR